jgi:hypothetical protein
MKGGVDKVKMSGQDREMSGERRAADKVTSI